LVDKDIGMQGYQLIFFTHCYRYHDDFFLGERLLQKARMLGLPSAPLLASKHGFDHDGQIHSASFFELVNQSIMVMMALSTANIECLFQRLRHEVVGAFYARALIKVGMTGAS
jgi:PII-like signaling protein